MNKEIKAIRQEIFERAKESPDLEIMHWWLAVDDIFENDEFNTAEFGNLQWRLGVLKEKKQPINHVASMITPILRENKLIPCPTSLIVKKDNRADLI